MLFINKLYKTTALLIAGLFFIGSLCGIASEELRTFPYEESDDPIEFQILKEVHLDGGGKVEYGKFVLHADLWRNKDVEFYYAVPLDSRGKATERANNIVFHCPFHYERDFITRPCQIYFPEKLGVSFFSVVVFNDLKELDQPEKTYCFRESGFQDLVFKAKELLEEQYGLENRKLLLTGESSGARMAERMVANFPDRIDAAAFVGGNNYKLLSKENTIPMFSCHTTGDDWGIADDFMLDYQLQKNGGQLLYTVTPPDWKRVGKSQFFHHSPGELAWEFIQGFLKAIIKLRDANNGVVPEYDKWPASAILNERKLYFPSQEFAGLWNSYPQKKIHRLTRYRLLAIYRKLIESKLAKQNIVVRKIAERVIASLKKGMSQPIYLIPDKPKKVVVWVQPMTNTDNIYLEDNMLYLWEHGVVCATIYPDDSYFKTVENIKKLIKEVAKKPEFKDLPIIVCGVGPGGMLGAVAALEAGERVSYRKVKKRIVGGAVITKKVKVRKKLVDKIVTINSEYDWPFEDLSISSTRKRTKSHLPLQMYFSKDFSSVIPKKTKYRKIKILDAEGETLGDKYFHYLEKIALNGVL